MKRKILFISFSFVMLIPAALIFRPSLIVHKEQVRAKYELPDSKYMQWKGAAIHYVDEGEGFPLLMIHGYGGSHRNFSKIAALLKDHFRVIRLDLPGFGMSDFPESEKDAEDMIGLYRNFMSHFLIELQLDSLHIMGNSLGGWMAWETAVAHPDKVKKLVLMCSAGYEMEKVANNAAFLIRLGFTKYFFEKGIPMMMSRSNADKIWFDASKANPDEIVANNAFWNREGNIPAAFQLAGSGQLPDTSLITKIVCPVMIVWGKEDEIISVAHAYKFERDISNHKLFIYDSCGHVPMLEKPERLKADFLAFIEEDF